MRMLSVLVVLLLLSACETVPEPADEQPAITSFSECARAGYPIMESYPRQCRLPDGATFTEEVAMINTFEECVASQGVVTQTFPYRCTTLDGRTFISETLPPGRSAPGDIDPGEPTVCPAVCVPMFVIREGGCLFNQCGSGCGPDGVTSFPTEAECMAALRATT